MIALRKIFIESIGLNERHLEQFLKVANRKMLNKKEYLIESNTVCEFFAFIEEGVMRSFVKNSIEEFNTDFYFEKSFVSAYSSFITRLPTEHSIQAIADTTVLCITLKQYNDLVDSDSEWLRLGKYLAEYFLIRKCQREISFLKHSATERMENMLITYPGIEQKVQQYHIASYLGIKPESLSRIKLLSYIEKQ